MRATLRIGSPSSGVELACDLKHNFAVWQRYALNGLHFPIDHVLNAYHRYPQNLDFIFNNRKVAISECDVASHRVALAAKLCFQPRNRCVHTLAQNSPVPVRRSGNIMLSARQGYALKHMAGRVLKYVFGY
jgi:hypothetical protein